MFFNYPYTDLYSLNLDWIIKAIRELQDKIDEDRGERVLSFNTRTGVVTLEAADVNGLTINAVGISPDLSAVTPAEMEEAFTAGIRVLLEVSASGYQKAGFLVNTVDGVEMLPLTADVSELKDKVEEIDAKVNPEGAAPGDVLTVNDAGETEWAAPEFTADLSALAPDYTNAHPAINEIGFYFIYGGVLRKSTAFIPAATPITDNNSTIVTIGGLNDIEQETAAQISMLDSKVNPEGGTPGDVLTIDTNGETIWKAPQGGGGGDYDEEIREIREDITNLEDSLDNLDTKINPPEAPTDGYVLTIVNGQSVWAPAEGGGGGGAGGTVNITVTPDAAGNYTPAGTVTATKTSNSSANAIATLTPNTPTAIQTAYNALNEELSISVTPGTAVTTTARTFLTAVGTYTYTFTGTPVKISGTVE